MLKDRMTNIQIWLKYQTSLLSDNPEDVDNFVKQL
jgi:hypothetical protein